MERFRQKTCDRCQQIHPVLYRIQHDESGRWVFACLTCLPDLKENNPHYAYGGTWKASKKRR